jgi:hypothetical protein
VNGGDEIDKDEKLRVVDDVRAVDCGRNGSCKRKCD